MNYAERKLRNARSVVVHAAPFFGTLLLKQQLVEDPTVEAMATDGVHLFYNSQWVIETPDDHLQGVCAHEACHPAFGHHARRGERRPDLWNIAADYSINPTLVRSGFALPEGGLGVNPNDRPDLQALGQAEKIYAKLFAELQAQQQPPPEEDDDEDFDNDDDGDEESGDDFADDEGDSTSPDEGREGGSSSAPPDAGQDSADSAGARAGGGAHCSDAGDANAQEGGPATPSPPDSASGAERGAAGGPQPAQDSADAPQGQGQSLASGASGPGARGASYGGCGSVLDCPDVADPVARQQEEAAWKVSVAQARMAHDAAVAAGKASPLPAELLAQIGALLAPRADWRELLRRYMDPLARDDYSWDRPNRRHIGRGLYLPSARSEQLQPILFVIDSSGSMSESALAQAASEVTAIAAELKPERLDVLFHDDHVNAFRSYEAGDEITELPRPSRGGTNFAPVCDWINRGEDTYACIVWFTDLQACDWAEAAAIMPDVPIIWIDPTDSTIEPPFGTEVVRMPYEEFAHD